MCAGINACATTKGITHEERPRLKIGNVEVEPVFNSV